MGENKWHDYDSWPVPGTRYVDYYLASGGKANTAAGDGRLNEQKPATRAPADTFVYDPADPVLTRGGGNCCWPSVIPWGPWDQREIEARNDVLVYSSPRLDEDLRVTGPVAVKLWIASSAVDTDFTGKLVDVAPDGRAINLTDGVRRLAYRNSYQRPEVAKPGTPIELTIDLWNTSNLFLKGHRIRVEVSSSNFPRYSRNLNTGEVPETETRIVKASQTVFHDVRHPSRVVLPVLAN
jgi:putative CocE/NonD family hydrolase